jgi:serine/threonine protein kinase
MYCEVAVQPTVDKASAKATPRSHAHATLPLCAREKIQLEFFTKLSIPHPGPDRASLCRRCRISSGGTLAAGRLGYTHLLAMNARNAHAVDRTDEVIGERYRLLNLLDRGGQGAVYRAQDLRDGDEVAVKVLNAPDVDGAEWRERMFREAHALTVLSGTAAVRVYHQVWAADGALCLIMELLRGSDFEDYLKQREAVGAAPSVLDLAPLLEPVVETLEAAHEVGILHRDIKPGNIYVQHDGSVRLLDFGLAKFVRMRSLTAAGFVAGSPNYIAPEGWKGKTQILDQRIDVYGLAAVIFRALTGKPPFAADDVRDVLLQATRGERPSLHALRPDLRPEVDDWVKQALAIEPDDRFTRVRAMWQALKSIAS